MMKKTLLVWLALATSLQAEDLPTVRRQAMSVRDYSSTIETRTALIERHLGISTNSWLCHFPKGYVVTLRWWDGAKEPRRVFKIDTDQLPTTDGYFLTLHQQSAPSLPADGKSHGRLEVGFHTPMQGITTEYFTPKKPGAQIETKPGDLSKIDEETELWSITSHVDGKSRKVAWMTIVVTKK